MEGRQEGRGDARKLTRLKERRARRGEEPVFAHTHLAGSKSVRKPIATPSYSALCRLYVGAEVRA